VTRRRERSDDEVPADVRRLLETGSWEGASLEVFIAGRPAVRGRPEALCRLWQQYRAVILRDWRRPGKPWAAQQCEEENDA
jgi:hypothetical protein